MNDFSLFLLDICENAIEANCKNIVINLELKENIIFAVHDDGNGISEENIEKVFIKGFSTKSNHQGIGLSKLKKCCEENDGFLKIESKENEYTLITGKIKYPLGLLEDTIISLLLHEQQIDIQLNIKNNNTFVSFDTKKIKKEFKGQSLSNMELIKRIKERLHNELY